MVSPHFRPDIEGLRAIAVLLVVGAHFGLPGLGAGFIGVDVFFVISGYLITGLLVREQESTGRIAVRRFYANRLRRLLPALATMLVASSLPASQLLADAENLAQSKAAAMAAVWASNFYFAFSDTNYFAAEAGGNAFLHTWSLGVEEQFYLFWPPCILAAFLWAGKRGKAPLLALWLGAICALSLGAYLVIGRTHPMFAFFMMPTRAWQFSAGALAWLLSRRCVPLPRQAGMGAWIGAALLLTSLWVIAPYATSPGLLALLPTLGACALLWAGAGPHGTAASRKHPGGWLCLPPMQRIGQLSYAWYLWHWPVLVIGESLLPIKGDTGNTLLAMAASLLAAAATHWLVENPIRYGRSARVKAEWQIGVALFAMLVLQSQLLRWHTYTKDLLASQSLDIYTRAAADLPIIYQHGCDDWYNSATLKPCGYGREHAAKTAVLLGDSIGAQWFPALAAMLDERQWKIVVLTKSSCPMVDEPFFYQRIGREYTECSAWRDKAIAWLQQQHVDRLFMGGTASPTFTDRQWTEGTRRILDRLAPHIGSIYLIEANPTLTFNGPQCLAQSKKTLESQASCRSMAASAQYTHVSALLKDAARAHHNTHWLETSSLVCPAGQCDAMRDGVVVFRDSQHLTASFTALAAPHFLRQIEQYEPAGP